MKPLRTALFVPGNRPDRVDKAISSKADAVFIDLEDAVPIAEKESTRPAVRAALDNNPGKRLYVRVNALVTPFVKDDLEAVVCNSLEGIVLPKVESPDDIVRIDKLLSNCEIKAGMKAGALEVIPICESARGLENISAIASVASDHQRVPTVHFGAADYTADLGISLTPGGKELDYPRSRLPVACRAAGLMPPIDTPWMVDLKDIEGLIADARKAKSLGFMGKAVIHPNHIDPCNTIFSPSEEEVTSAERVIAAFEEAERQGKAAIQLEGRFIDYALVKKSKRVVELARMIGM